MITRRQCQRSLSFALFASLIFGLSFRQHIQRAIRDAGYLLRPIWDTPEAPFAILPHYRTYGLSIEQRCALHAWTPFLDSQGEGSARRGRRVIDAFLFNTEDDLLELRIRELQDVVDIFLIGEPDHTFTGIQKRHMRLPQLLAGRLAFAAHKIIGDRLSLQTTGEDLLTGVNLNSDETSNFAREASARSQMTGLLHSARVGLQEDDLVVMSDLDEIPSAEALSLLRDCWGYGDAIHLQLRNYLYSFEFPVPDGAGMLRPKVLRYTATPEGPSMLYTHFQRSSDFALAGAGWHCSWCFRNISEFQHKMQAYSHVDRTTSYNLRADIIQDRICNGESVEGMYPEAYSFRALVAAAFPLERSADMLQVPLPLVQDPQKFRFLLPGGCLRDL